MTLGTLQNNKKVKKLFFKLRKRDIKIRILRATGNSLKGTMMDFNFSRKKIDAVNSMF